MSIRVIPDELVISPILSDDVVRSAATTSWIDRRLFPKVPAVDFDSDRDFIANNTASRELILGAKAYRFCNFLEALIRLNQGRIVAYGFTEQSGIYRPASFAGIKSETFPIIRDCTATAKDVTFTQTVGARTQSPEVIGEQVGRVVGGPLGWSLTGRIGREAAEQQNAFPPIWTTISLTIDVDGSTRQKVLHHSLFPSMAFFRLDVRNQNFIEVDFPYDARSFYRQWNLEGWGDGNPCKIPSPKGWGDNRKHNLHPQAPAYEAGAGNFKKALRPGLRNAD